MPLAAKIKKNLPILLLSLGHGTVDFYVNLLPAVAPTLALYLGLPLGDVVALVGVGAFVTNAVQPIVGYVMGNRNLAWILWVGVAVSVLPSFMGWSFGFWSLAGLIVVGAIGTGAYHPEGILSAHDASGENAHFGVPLFMSGGTFLNAVAAPVAILWVKYFGYPSMALLAFPGLLVSATFLSSYRKQRRKHPSVAMRPRSHRVTAIGGGRVSFWRLLSLSMFLGISTGLLFAIISSHYELRYGPDARTWAGWVLMVFGGVGSLASFVWGKQAKERGYFRIVLWTQLVAAPLFAVLAFAPSAVAGFVIAIPLSIFAPGAIYPAGLTMAKHAVGLTQALRVGLMVGGTWGAASIMIFISGRLIGRGVDSSNLVLISAVCSFIAALLAGWQVVTKSPGTGAQPPR